MISILQLQYFRQLAKKQHIGKTAEELHISAAALSMTIRKMEEDLGIPLFDRQNHQIALNQYGEEYLRYAEAALSSLEQGRMQLESMWKSRMQKLSISVSLAQMWMDRIFSFQVVHPGCYIAVYQVEKQRSVEMICDYSVDFVLLGTTDIEDKRLECLTLTTNRIAVFLAKDHPLAARSGLYLHELQEEPFIDLSPSFPFRGFCDKLFAQSGLGCNRIAEVDYDMRMRLVQRGTGYALTSNFPGTEDRYHNGALIPLLDKNAVRSIGLFWKKGRQFTPIMKDFCQYIQSVTPSRLDPEADIPPFMT